MANIADMDCGKSVRSVKGCALFCSGENLSKTYSVGIARVTPSLKSKSFVQEDVGDLLLLQV